MDQNLDHANICPGCGRMCGFRKRFCDDECFERWIEMEREGFHPTPGHYTDRKEIQNVEHEDDSLRHIA